jgi:hypothetical protein
MVGMDHFEPLGDSESEGGATARDRPDRVTRTRPPDRPPQDTSEGCKAMAAADLARAAREAPGWSRIRYEHSAVMWSRRAEWLVAAETPARRG